MSAIKVVQLEQTCMACPSQWEGKLADGSFIYVRYRWGNLTIERGDTPDEAVRGNLYVDETIGEDMDGYLTIEEVAKAATGIFDFSDFTGAAPSVSVSQETKE